MTIDKISVIGTGTMGSGIVQALAQAGRKVTMKSRSEASNTKAMGRITKSLGKLVEKGKMEQAAMDATLANITVTTDYKDIADSDLIIEAEEMERIRCLQEAVLASHCGRTAQHVRADTERQLVLAPDAAVDYGIVDHVLTRREAPGS